MKVYGIKSCGSVRKALAYFKMHGIDYAFVDLKTAPVDRATILEWLQTVPLEKLFNNKGTKYRTLGLSGCTLSDAEKIDWLANENLLIKRPVIEQDNGNVCVAFDEAHYDKIFGV